MTSEQKPMTFIRFYLYSTKILIMFYKHNHNTAKTAYHNEVFIIAIHLKYSEWINQFQV